VQRTKLPPPANYVYRRPDVERHGGYLDGEGCFSINGGTPRVHVTSCYPPWLFQLQEAYGGTVRQMAKRKRRKNGGIARTQFEWYVSGDGARRCCCLLLAYRAISEKKAQAGLLLDWSAAKPNSSTRKHIETELRALKRIDYGQTEEADTPR